MTPQQLKNSILQRAMEGRLVEQRPEEGTAKELLKEIQAEKARLVKEGKIKKSKSLPPITEQEMPFDIPEGWEWVRFDEFGVYKKGPFGSALTKSMFVPKGVGTVKVYEQKNAIQKDASLGSYYISKKYFNEHMTGFEVKAGDIIVSCAGTIGETYILPDDCEKGIINQALMRMQLMPSVYVQFFLLYFDSILKNTARKSSKGSALKNIPPFSELKSYLVPLPPLAEQHRIIAKIEELLPLIDKYDKAYTKLTDFNTRFPEAMKKSLLQYTIQGKLVEQRNDEGTAQDLIKDIQAEKKRLIAEKKIKKSKALPPITEEEIPFDIPESWEWVRLGEISLSVADGDHQAPPKASDGIPFLVISNVSGGRLDFSNTRFVPKEYFDKLSSERIAELNDILFTVTGSYGIPILVETNRQFCFQRHIALIKSIMITEYLLWALNSPLIKQYCDNVATGTAQKTVGLTSLKNMIIPLPPLAEQHRIVAKLEEMLPFCDQLIK